MFSPCALCYVWRKFDKNYGNSQERIKSARTKHKKIDILIGKFRENSRKCVKNHGEGKIIRGLG